MDVASESTSGSADFDITCSSYMKIGSGNGRSEAHQEDFDRLLAIFTASSDGERSC